MERPGWRVRRRWWRERRRVRSPGLVRGRLHSANSRAMKPRSASASLASTSLVHLIEEGEVVQCLRRGFADRLHRPAQIREDFPDGNQAVSFTLHGVILPQDADADGYFGGEADPSRAADLQLENSILHNF